MTRIEKIISDLSEMFEFYEKIKEHKKEKARAEKAKISDTSTEKDRQKASEIRGKYKCVPTRAEALASQGGLVEHAWNEHPPSLGMFGTNVPSRL